jgi:hypothetical protein
MLPVPCCRGQLASFRPDTPVHRAVPASVLSPSPVNPVLRRQTLPPSLGFGPYRPIEPLPPSNLPSRALSQCSRRTRPSRIALLLVRFMLLLRAPASFNRSPSSVPIARVVGHPLSGTEEAHQGSGGAALPRPPVGAAGGLLPVGDGRTQLPGPVGVAKLFFPWPSLLDAGFRLVPPQPGSSSGLLVGEVRSHVAPSPAFPS